MKHTVAPWKVNCDDGSSIAIIGNAGNNARGQQHIASVVYDADEQKAYLPHTPDHETAQANARLIASAPNLLEAALCAVAALTQNATFPADIALAVSALRAAIAKTEKEYDHENQ